MSDAFMFHYSARYEMPGGRSGAAGNMIYSGFGLGLDAPQARLLPRVALA